jgi:hypothetical protein
VFNIWTFWYDPETERTLRNRPDLSRRTEGFVSFEVVDGPGVGEIVEVPHEDLVTKIGQIPAERGEHASRQPGLFG